MANEKKTLTVHGRMANIKKELAERTIPKSGHNKFAGFHYHELSDFINHINDLNLKHGVNDLVEINESEGYCKITLINVDDSQDSYSIVTPYREAEMLAKGGAPSNTDAIQRMGSTITYNRRYLYMTAYNIQENDGVDPQEPGKGTKKQPNQPNKKDAKPKERKLNAESWEKRMKQIVSGELKVEDFKKGLKDNNYIISQEQQESLKNALTELELTKKQ